MSKFDDYENVKSRKLRFYKDNPGGIIMVDLLNQDHITEYALVKATIYLSKEDYESRVPKACGMAMEIRDKELSKTQFGKEYASVNYTSWTENCEESAIGRALDNAGYASNGKCSKEEMQKAERAQNRTTSKKQTGNPGDFVIPVGKSKGLQLSEMGPKKCDEFLTWIESLDSVTGPLLDTQKALEKYLNSVTTA